MAKEGFSDGPLANPRQPLLGHIEERLSAILQLSDNPLGLRLCPKDHLLGVSVLDLMDLELVLVLDLHGSVMMDDHIQIQVDHLIAILRYPFRRGSYVDKQGELGGGTVVVEMPPALMRSTEDRILPSWPDRLLALPTFGALGNGYPGPVFVFTEKPRLKPPMKDIGVLEELDCDRAHPQREYVPLPVFGGTPPSVAFLLEGEVVCATTVGVIALDRSLPNDRGESG